MRMSDGFCCVSAVIPGLQIIELNSASSGSAPLNDCTDGTSARTDPIVNLLDILHLEHVLLSTAKSINGEEEDIIEEFFLNEIPSQEPTTETALQPMVTTRAEKERQGLALVSTGSEHRRLRKAILFQIMREQVKPDNTIDSKYWLTISQRKTLNSWLKKKTLLELQKELCLESDNGEFQPLHSRVVIDLFLQKNSSTESSSEEKETFPITVPSGSRESTQNRSSIPDDNSSGSCTSAIQVGRRVKDARIPKKGIH
ncbi:hypothetical protein T439DRAFT_357108 [Meredithblackwellia eburnea MCA 4105]